jgi:transcriptional regulator with XRE-family HTH domain
MAGVATRPRFNPPTPRSRRLGRELRRLREAAKLTLEQVGVALECSPSRVQRIESGEIRVRPGDVMEILNALGVGHDTEPGRTLLTMTQGLRETGWWQQLGSLSQKYLTYIAFESEATRLLNYEPTLVPGLLQTEDYARSVISAGWDLEPDAINERVQARLKRQSVLTREQKPLRLWAVVSEAVVLCDVGGREVLVKQLGHLVEMSKLPNVSIQVLPFAAGAHLADKGGFALLSFEKGDPDLGYIETLGGELFLESTEDIRKLSAVYDNLKTLALSPAESTERLRSEMSR